MWGDSSSGEIWTRSSKVARREMKRKKSEVVIYYSHIHTILCLLTIIILPFCDRIAESIGQTKVAAKKIESLNRVACALHNNSTNSYRWLFCGRSLNFTGNPRTGTMLRPKKVSELRVRPRRQSQPQCYASKQKSIFGWARMSVWSVWNYRKHSFDTKKKMRNSLRNPLSICYHRVNTSLQEISFCLKFPSKKQCKKLTSLLSAAFSALEHKIFSEICSCSTTNFLVS